MDRQQEIKRQIDKLTSRSFWIGAIFGLLLGIAAGIAIGYGIGSPQTVGFPLTQGIKT